MCLGKRKGGLKFSDCIGHVAIGVIKHFWSQCTLSCTQNTHSPAASQGRSYQIPLSMTVTGNVSEPSKKLTYALQWCQSEIPGTSSGPRVQLSFLGCQMCSTTGWGQPFVALKHCWLSSLLSDVSRHPTQNLSQITAAARRWPSVGLSREQCPPQHLPGSPCSLLQTVGNAIWGHCSPGSLCLLQMNWVLPSPGYLFPCLRVRGGNLGASASPWQL